MNSIAEQSVYGVYTVEIHTEQWARSCERCHPCQQCQGNHTVCLGIVQVCVRLHIHMHAHKDGV